MERGLGVGCRRQPERASRFRAEIELDVLAAASKFRDDNPQASVCHGGPVVVEPAARSPICPPHSSITHLRKLLVPIDGSPCGAVALGTAIRLMKATGAAMQPLEVAVKMPAYVHPGELYGSTCCIDPAREEETVSRARNYVKGIVERVRTAGVVVDGEHCWAASPTLLFAVHIARCQLVHRGEAPAGQQGAQREPGQAAPERTVAPSR